MKALNYNKEIDEILKRIWDILIIIIDLQCNYSGYFSGIVFSYTCNLAIARRGLYLDI